MQPDVDPNALSAAGRGGADGGGSSVTYEDVVMKTLDAIEKGDEDVMRRFSEGCDFPNVLQVGSCCEFTCACRGMLRRTATSRLSRTKTLKALKRRHTQRKATMRR